MLCLVLASDSESDDGNSDADSETELKSTLSMKKKEFRSVQDKIEDFCDEETKVFKAKEKKFNQG